MAGLGGLPGEGLLQAFKNNVLCTDESRVETSDRNA